MPNDNDPRAWSDARLLAEIAVLAREERAEEARRELAAVRGLEGAQVELPSLGAHPGAAGSPQPTRTGEVGEDAPGAGQRVARAPRRCARASEGGVGGAG
jgi:hypothetical protein